MIKNNSSVVSSVFKKIPDGGITTEDVSDKANIGYSKINLFNSLKDTDINEKAEISYSKLKLIEEIKDEDISKSAGIKFKKLERKYKNSVAFFDNDGIINSVNLSPNKLVVTDEKGIIKSIDLSTEDVMLSSYGLKGNVQNQIDSKEQLIEKSDKSKYYRGDKTFSELNTDAIIESSKKFYSEDLFDKSLKSKTTDDFLEGINNKFYSSDLVFSGINSTRPIIIDRKNNSIGVEFSSEKSDGVLSKDSFNFFKSKQDLITGAASSIALNDLDKNSVVITDKFGKIISSNVNSSKLSLIDIDDPISEILSKKVDDCTYEDGDLLARIDGKVGSVSIGEDGSVLSVKNKSISWIKLNDGKVFIENGVIKTKKHITLIVSKEQTNTTIMPEAIVDFITEELPIGNYKYTAFIVFKSSAYTTGIGFRINPVTASMCNNYGSFSISQGVNGTSHNFCYNQTSSETNVTSAAVPLLNYPSIATASGIFTVSSMGTVSMFFRPEVANSSVSVLSGSYINIEEI